ncbi:MAG: hypothetical protein H7A51_13820 [Akkermansiaceae bacterium]|nr:hypothetical protein [Akkermansiaceae bacterium]
MARRRNGSRFRYAPSPAVAAGSGYSSFYRQIFTLPDGIFDQARYRALAWFICYLTDMDTGFFGSDAPVEPDLGWIHYRPCMVPDIVRDSGISAALNTLFGYNQSFPLSTACIDTFSCNHMEWLFLVCLCEAHVSEESGRTSRCIRPLTVFDFTQFYSNHPFVVCVVYTPAVELYVR